MDKRCHEDAAWANSGIPRTYAAAAARGRRPFHRQHAVRSVRRHPQREDPALPRVVAAQSGREAHVVPHVPQGRTRRGVLAGRL